MQETTSKGMAGTIPVFCAFDKIVPLDEMKPNPKNPNKHPHEQIQLLAKIIEAQGWRAPVTVSTLSGMIVRGHGRYQAAQLIGCPVPVDYQNYPSEAEELADLLADNRIAELAEIDKAALAAIFKDIDAASIDAALSGYTSTEIDHVLQAVSEGISEDDFDQFFEPAEDDNDDDGIDEPAEDDEEPRRIRCPHCGEWIDV